MNNVPYGLCERHGTTCAKRALTITMLYRDVTPDARDVAQVAAERAYGGARMHGAYLNIVEALMLAGA